MKVSRAYYIHSTIQVEYREHISRLVRFYNVVYDMALSYHDVGVGCRREMQIQ